MLEQTRISPSKTSKIGSKQEFTTVVRAVHLSFSNMPTSHSSLNTYSHFSSKSSNFMKPNLPRPFGKIGSKQEIYGILPFSHNCLHLNFIPFNCPIISGLGKRGVQFTHIISPSSHSIKVVN